MITIIVADLGFAGEYISSKVNFFVDAPVMAFRNFGRLFSDGVDMGVMDEMEGPEEETCDAILALSNMETLGEGVELYILTWGETEG